MQSIMTDYTAAHNLSIVEQARNIENSEENYRRRKKSVIIFVLVLIGTTSMVLNTVIVDSTSYENWAKYGTFGESPRYPTVGEHGIGINHSTHIKAMNNETG